MSSLTNLLDISIADVVKIEQQVDYRFTSNFADGKLDGIDNFEPAAYQWFNSDYRRGYLVGVAKRIDTEYAKVEG